MKLLAALLLANGALAQTGTLEAAGAIGYAAFLDDSDQSHSLTGGSVRAYVSRRWSIGPEALYLYRSAGDKDVVLQGFAACDLGPLGRKATPYFVAGGGRLWGLRTRFTESSWTGGFGGGVRVMLNEKWFLAPEARLGWEPLLRVQVNIGYRSSR